MARYPNCDPLERYGVENGQTNQTDSPDPYDDYEEIDHSRYRADGTEFEGKGWRTKFSDRPKSDATQYYKCLEGVNCSGCKDNQTTGYYDMEVVSKITSGRKSGKVRCGSCHMPIWHRKTQHHIMIEVRHQLNMMNQGELKKIGDEGRIILNYYACSKCKKGIVDYFRELVKNSEDKIKDESDVRFKVKTCGWCAGELIEYLEKIRRAHSNAKTRMPRLKKLGHWSIVAKRRAKIRDRKRAKK